MKRALLTFALLAGALIAWTLEPHVFAEEPVVVPEKAEAAEVASWDESTRGLLNSLCTMVLPPTAAVLVCECMVDEAEKRIPEEVFMLWLATEGQANGLYVSNKLDEAFFACKAKAENI